MSRPSSARCSIWSRACRRNRSCASRRWTSSPANTACRSICPPRRRPCKGPNEPAEGNPERVKGKDDLKFPEFGPLPRPGPFKLPSEKAIQEAAAAEKTAELGKKQAELQFDTKDTADLVKPHAADAAKNL